MCNTFSSLVFNLSRMLKREDLEAISYLYRLPVDISAGNSATGLSYMRELEKKNMFSSSNLNGLRELLKSIQRCDLFEIVEEFERERQQKDSGRQQPCMRPQEESIRLNMSYTQAKKTEEDLAEFQKELIAFCSRHADSPDVRQFCTGMSKRLKEIKENCHQFTTVPLHEIIHSFYLTPAKSVKQSQGDRQWQHYTDSITHDQPGGVIQTGGSRSNSGATGSGQRRQKVQTTTQGQTSQSPPAQTSPPLRRDLAATLSPLPPAHFVLNQPQSDMDYDMLSPLDTNEPSSVIPREQRDRSGAFYGFEASSRATSRSEETLTTLHHDPRPPKFSKSRGHSTGRIQHAVGKQQNNRLRSSNRQSSSIPIPSLKRMNSADDLLSDKPSSACSPSRIPILLSSPKHQRRQFITVQHSSRDSSDLSGGSYSEGDFTGSIDSGVDVRELEIGRRFGRYSGSLSTDLSLPLGTSHREKEYAHLNKATMEASPIYQKPQASL